MKIFLQIFFWRFDDTDFITYTLCMTHNQNLNNPDGNDRIYRRRLATEYP